MFGEAPPVAVVQGDGNSFTLAERGSDSLGEATAVLRKRRDSINENKHVRPRAYPLFRAIFIESHHLAIYLCAHKSGCLQLCGDCDIRTMCRRGQGECHDDVFPVPCPVSRQYVVNHLLHRIPLHLAATSQAGLRPGASPQQAQEIIDFRGRPDRRATRCRGVLLFDRDGW